ncbi:SET domain protein [Plasmodium gonderi]|uniref:SET domain protein n=1 Tax=Plasmodium gonderi TaxID=77519 RepID=A0A1Y1JC19_PLAGO|nr:SET domain protein [Plasmodium gonderi]GAW79218.1 SET domain protein [Plasmodium gonderi]
MKTSNAYENVNANASSNKCSNSKNVFTNSASVIWIEKEKLDSIIHIPLYSNLSKYVSDLSRHPVKQKKKEDILSKIFLLFDDNSCNIAVDISPLCESNNNKIPLLIYERYYFWSLHFLFEKSKIKRQKLNICSDFNWRCGINKYNMYDDDVYMYTSIYNCAYNRNDDEKNGSINNYSELATDNHKEVNKELTIYNKDYIKYLYLNDLKNNAMGKNGSNEQSGENDPKITPNGDSLFEQNVYSNNEIKWYRLKIKIESVEKKKKNKNYKQNMNKNKNSTINRLHYKNFNIYNNSSSNKNINFYYNSNKNFFSEKRTCNNFINPKKETYDHSFNANIMNKISHLSLIDNDATRKNISNLIKMQKESFCALNQGNDKNILDTSNDELLQPTSNRRSNESIFNSNKGESLVSISNHNGKRRKRKNWFYYESSSNETNPCLYDDDDKTISGRNFVCVPDRGCGYAENKRKKKRDAHGNGDGNANENDQMDDHKNDPTNDHLRGQWKNIFSVLGAVNNCGSAKNSPNRQGGNSEKKEVLKSCNPEPSISYDHVITEELKDTLTNLNVCSENRTYVRMVNAGDSSTQFHSFDIEEEIEAHVLENVPITGKEDIPERICETEKSQTIMNEEKNNERDNNNCLIGNTKLYPKEIEECNTEFRSIVSEECDKKDDKLKSMKRRNHNNEAQNLYINKILNNIINKQKSHLNSLSKNFERIQGFYKQNYKIFLIQNKDDLNAKRNCFKNDQNLYVLSSLPTNDEFGNDLNIFDQFKAYLRMYKTGKNQQNYQTKKDINLCNPRGTEKCNSKNEADDANCTEKKEHAHEGSNSNLGNDVIEEASSLSEKKIEYMNIHNATNYSTKIVPVPKGGKEDTEIALQGGEAAAAVVGTQIHATNLKASENEIIFHAVNKKSPSCVKRLKEGDYLYIKFNYSYDDYDKIRVLKKENVLQILIYLMQNQECLKLSNISTYSPDLLWNLSLHFKKNTHDMELNLDKMYSHFCKRYEIISLDGEPRAECQLKLNIQPKGVSKRDYEPEFEQKFQHRFEGKFKPNLECELEPNLERKLEPNLERELEPNLEPHFEAESDSDSFVKNARCIKSAKKARKENLKEMEIMKLKDNVSFLDKFLQNVNDAKLKKLKKMQTEYYKKYEFDRTINRLNKQELINLFIDKKIEMNTLPLSFLKEKGRNIIYEENIKMNMFACIKIIFDDIKGRCIYAASDLNKFDFIFEYVGELLTHNEAMERERKYNKNKKKGCYMFYFKHENKRYCIDGTEENIDAAINNKDKKYFLRSFARLVNHSKKNANLIPKVLTVCSLPRLFFVAARNIKEGEELLIDYGERNREIIKNNEWLKR